MIILWVRKVLIWAIIVLVKKIHQSDSQRQRKFLKGLKLEKKIRLKDKRKTKIKKWKPF